MPGGHDQPNSYYGNMEESEKKRRATTRPSMPIACRVCDRVFLDNVSLVLHFDESHNADDVPMPGQQSRTLSDIPLSFPEMNDYPRPCSLPVFPAKAPNRLSRDVSDVQIPVLNSMPPLSLPFDGRWRPTWLSTISQRATPSSLSSRAVFYPQVGAAKAARGSAAVPLQLNKQNRGGQYSKYRNRKVKQLKKPCKEIIVISDDDDNGDDDKQNGPVETLDLTLKL
ncbi:hypothetical protein Salat_1551200 [Sesamum alatum]|uniref:C2H2-type domain-containing protein n=1 Tax=Sesamum alatum TaxID=300844 RepID=A0AAE1YCW7_9LAMI|nr:hypothetical protein Salat_1551200 [Sesamum alatum]